jgi:hypothetical protein
VELIAHQVISPSGMRLIDEEERFARLGVSGTTIK